MSTLRLGDDRRIVVIDDQIGRAGPFRESFLDAAGRDAGDFVFLTGQDAAGRNCVETTVERVGRLWLDSDPPRLALVLLDLRFDDPDDPDAETFGLRLLEALRRECGSVLPVVMLVTEVRKRETAGERGADGFLPKTDLDTETLDRQLSRNGLVPAGGHDLQGNAVSFLLALREIRRVVERGVGEILLLGETGTGKSAIARYAHAASPRRDAPFEKWVARANNADVHYSELFGYWRGAFTDARAHKAGIAEAAHGGTLFIDEIAELTPDGQTALFEYRDRHRTDGLRRVRRLGRCPGAGAAGVPANYAPDEDRILVDTFLVTATNKPIQDPAWRGEHGFRQELYNRLGHRVEIPPLRARCTDVEPLFRYFLEHAAGRPLDIAPDVRDRLASHPWTDGNVAELAALADGVCARLGPDFDRVRLNHLDGLLAAPLAAPGTGEASATGGGPRGGGTPSGTGGGAPGAYVDYEVQMLSGLAERLRTAVVETRTARGAAGALTDILKHATGVEYQPTDAKRELKAILADWFDPGTRKRSRWERHAAYARDRARITEDDILAALYRYGADEIAWEEAKTNIESALRHE